MISRYRREAGRNDSIAKVLRKLDDTGSSLTYADAQRVAGKSGQILGSILSEELAAAFPDGQIPEEIARAVIPEALRQNADLVNRVTREVQRRKNVAAHLPEDPPKAVFRGDRAENLARWAAKQERFADHGTIFSQYVEQNSRMTVDDAVRDQAKVHHAMGLSPKIVRKAAPGCCNWCTAHAGTVAYGPGMDKEIFRRHKNCPCLIEYDPGTGAKDRQRVENYRFSKKMEPEEVERRKQMAVSKGRLITSPVDLRVWPDGKEPPLSIGRSVGAAYKDTDVTMPDGTVSKLAPGTRIERIRLIGGYGRDRKIDEIDGLMLRYPGTDEDFWMKKKGIGYVIYEGEAERAEIHWYEHPKVGRVEYKLKPDTGGNWFLEEE